MYKKLCVIFITLLLTIPATIIILPRNMNAQAEGGAESGEDLDLDYSYIYNRTKDLSDIIKNAPLDHGMQKGRAFGTTGEHLAKTYIEGWMDDLGLNTTVEQMKSGHLFSENNSYDDGISKLEVYGKGMKINGTEELTDFYIAPRWTSDTILPHYVDLLRPWLGSERDKLTFNESYSDLILINRPQFPEITQFLIDNRYNIHDEIEQKNIIDFESFLDYVLDGFQDEYDFTFENLTEENASQLFSWFNDTVNSLPRSNFLLIDEDPFSNFLVKILYFPPLTDRKKLFLLIITIK